MLSIDGNDLGKRRADNDVLVDDREACLEVELRRCCRQGIATDEDASRTSCSRAWTRFGQPAKPPANSRRNSITHLTRCSRCLSYSGRWLGGQDGRREETLWYRPDEV